MDFYERIADAFDRHRVNRAQVGRETGMSGQAVTQKLQRKSAVTPAEIQVYARYAQMTVSEALGEGSVVIQAKDEQDLIELYRLLTPEQRQAWLGVGTQMVARNPAPDPAPAE